MPFLHPGTIPYCDRPRASFGQRDPCPTCQGRMTGTGTHGNYGWCMLMQQMLSTNQCTQNYAKIRGWLDNGKHVRNHLTLLPIANAYCNYKYQPIILPVRFQNATVSQTVSCTWAIVKVSPVVDLEKFQLPSDWHQAPQHVLLRRKAANGCCSKTVHNKPTVGCKYRPF